MNLICFPHYTCGGLLCDIMSNQFSAVDKNGGISAIAHNVGKIGDTDAVLTDFSVDDFMQAVVDVSVGSWVGTHCWPGNLPLDQFEQVIVISTATYRSRIYRWLRAYHHYFLPQWSELSGMELIDKTRETAKNYTQVFEPVHHPRVTNLEFADVVETTAEFKHAVLGHQIDTHMQRWKKINSFLYRETLWHDFVVKEFSRAEHEQHLLRYYRYE